MFLKDFGLVAHAAAAAILILGCKLTYNVWFHPLRSYPGPWYVTISIAWFLYHTAKGDIPFAIHQLHLQYGPVVRIAPDELSYVQAEAWKDIYGTRGGAAGYIKDPSTTFAEDPAHPNIVVATGDQHAKLRKLLSPAFSDKALREQESLLSSYVMALINGLRANSSDQIDLVKWFNFITFDVIGDLTFGMIFSVVKYLTWTIALSRLAPGCVELLISLIPQHVMHERNATWLMAKEKIMRRKERTPTHTDFATHLLKAEEAGTLEMEDLVSNAPILVVAGSETTATLLSGAAYYATKNPPVYKRLAEEIRSAFRNHSEITISRVSELRYLHAVLDESLRVYPPGNSNHPRLLPPQGATICGNHVPGGTLVGIGNYSCFRSASNFANPDDFVPERLLGKDPLYDNDKREALQPFGIGPRNCIGRNLAYNEMRLVFAHLLLEFDIELLPESENWEDQKVFSTWMKKPLMVQLHPVAR